LPQAEFAGEGLSWPRLAATVDAARENGFAAVSVNDHFLFGAPWLDGLTVLAAVAERSGPMTLATTVSLAALRGPVPLAKAHPPDRRYPCVTRPEPGPARLVSGRARLVPPRTGRARPGPPRTILLTRADPVGPRPAPAAGRAGL
jgi:hypothetical protein